MGGVEFLGPDGGPPAGEDEVLETGPRTPGRLERVPRGVWTGGAITAVAVVVALAVTGTGRSHHAPAPAPAPSDASAVDRTMTAEELAVGLVRSQARDTAPLGDIVRAGVGEHTCRLVRTGGPPQARIERTMRRALPEFTVRDVGRILDPNTALCAVTVRAHDAHGTVLVVTVVAPQAPARDRTTFTRVDEPSDGRVTAVALHTTPGGWVVRAGTDGPMGDEPRPVDLITLAEDPTLRW